MKEAYREHGRDVSAMNLWLNRNGRVKKGYEGKRNENTHTGVDHQKDREYRTCTAGFIVALPRLRWSAVTVTPTCVNYTHSITSQFDKLMLRGVEIYVHFGQMMVLAGLESAKPK